MSNLREYAEVVTSGGEPHKRCLTCALPPDVKRQVNEARTGDVLVQFPIISEWLEQETGVKMHPNTIRNHFVAGHHND